MVTKFDKYIQDYLGDNIQTLNLSSKSLSVFDKDLSKYPKLKKIIFSNNLFESIPKCFKILEHIECIEFDNNLLKSVGNVFHYLPTLKTLSLNSNKIVDFFTKNQAKQMNNLENLYLNDNPIKKIDLEVFDYFNSLKNLYLNNVKLEEDFETALFNLAVDKFTIHRD